MYNITFIHNSHTNNKIVQSVAYSQSKWERGRGREREKEKQRTSDDFLCWCESHNFPYFYSFTATLSCICSFISIQLTQLTKLKSNSNFFIILFSSVHIHTFLCSLVLCVFSLHVYCSQLNIIRIFFLSFFGERIRIHIETEMKIWNKVWISLFRLSLNNSSNNITQFISISTHECIRQDDSALSLPPFFEHEKGSFGIFLLFLFFICHRQIVFFGKFSFSRALPSVFVLFFIRTRERGKIKFTQMKPKSKAPKNHALLLHFLGSREMKMENKTRKILK